MDHLVETSAYRAPSYTADANIHPYSVIIAFVKFSTCSHLDLNKFL
jgi:hypothetical protein